MTTPKFLAHGPLQRLASNLWWLGGELPGMSLRRCMVVVQLGNGRLLVHNAINLDEETRRTFEALGTPEAIVVPSALHRLDAPAYAARYPGARFYAPRGARAEVEKKVTVHGTYEEFPSTAAATLLPLAGIADVEGVLRVESDDGVSLVFNDVVFNMDKKKDLLGWFFTTLLGSAPGPRISRLTKLLLVKDRAALRENLLALADTPRLVRVAVAHEKVAHGEDAPAALRAAASYL